MELVFHELGIVGAAIAQLFRLWLVIRIIAWSEKKSFSLSKAFH
jgi:hypothetical protein